MMRGVLMIIFGFVLLFTPAWSANLKLTLTNMSGDQITAITGKPVNTEADTENLIIAPIAVVAKADVTIEAEEGVCVFDLQFTFASGQIQSRPDTDFCQTDQIIVE